MPTTHLTCNLTRPFLTASWQDLLLLNWRVDPRLLQPYLPEGTELDSFCGEHYVSLVGFRFLNMAVKGIPAVGFRDFPEVNLRFYVCRNTAEDVRRGVVFIREMTPRRLVEWFAQRFYNEPYRTLPMRYQIEEQYVSYEWKLDGRWQGMSIQPSGEWNEPPSNSNDTFFVLGLQPATRWRDAGVRGDSSQVESALGQAYPVRSLLGQAEWFGMGGGTHRRTGVGCIGGGVGSRGVSRPQDLTAQ